MEKYGYRFSFGPWNIHEGADPFGPTVRPPLAFADKLAVYKKLGFDAVQFHDDDAVPDLDDLSPAQIAQQARAVQQQLDDHGLVAEFVAPRLWENPHDHRRRLHLQRPAGARLRHRALQACRRHRQASWARDLIVLWLAREGTYMREAKDAGARHRASCSRPSTPCWTTTRACASPSSPSPTSRWTRPTSRPSATPWRWASRPTTRRASAC